MASPVSDVYAPCPCGSGKKIKFCCSAAIKELDRVAQLHEKGQLDGALATLNKINERFPEAPIVPLTRAQLLMEGERFTDAATEMRIFLISHPDNGNGTALLAFAHFMDVGFHQAKPEIHRAFQVSAQVAPDVLASLAIQIGNEVFNHNPMSAREHFALALRLTTDGQERQALFSQLMKLDGSVRIPFPMRGSHQLEKVDAPEGSEKELRNAYRLSAAGCWGIAGKLFQKVGDKLTDSWALWKNIGLCRVWDDDLTGGAEALHKAAELAPDYESAVECETVAQLSSLHEVEETVPVKMLSYRVKSASKVLTTLDAQPLLSRDTARSQQQELVGHYYVLDRALVGPDTPITDENASTILGEIQVYDVPQEEGSFSSLAIIAIDGADKETVTKLIEPLIQDEIIAVSHDHDHDHGHDCGHDHDDPAPTMRGERNFRMALKELLPLQRTEYYGDRLKGRERRARTRAVARRFVEQSWLQTPLKRLNGKTPREAAGDAALKTKLAAAVLVLESMDYGVTLATDFNKLRADLNIEAFKPLPITDQSLNSLSVIQSHRLALKELNDEQLGHVLHRALLIRHIPFAYTVLQVAQQRGLENLQGMDQVAFAQTMSEISRELGHDEEGLNWAKVARELAEQGEDFRRKLTNATREFEFRSEDPNDPELPNIIDRLWNYYGAKLPELRESLKVVLADLKLPIPGETASGIVLPDSMVVGAGASSGSKLWLPE